LKEELQDVEATLACFDMDHRCELDDLQNEVSAANSQL